MQYQTVPQFQITSDAFVEGGQIPKEYTCDGESRSPQLAWSGPSTAARSFALIMDDPDAPKGTFVHWVLYDLPAKVRELAANVPSDSKLPNGARQGRNSAGKIGYMGPCPPSGTHRYVFHLYALDSQLNLPSEASKEEVMRAMAGHVLGEAQLMGRYAR